MYTQEKRKKEKQKKKKKNKCLELNILMLTINNNYLHLIDNSMLLIMYSIIQIFIVKKKFIIRDRDQLESIVFIIGTHVIIIDYDNDDD